MLLLPFLLLRFLLPSQRSHGRR
uniref:Uncharacterized protein n=1 Tax=Rhizophora mucronata TaxID=61149 RepID=A0A2P2P5Y9_RHIMU